jgi:adenine-specific DNA-methyltransferase
LTAIPTVAHTEGTAQSADPVSDNLQALRTLFPQAFADDKLDFDVLRQLLGDVVDDGDEKYGLNWNGKRQARRLALTPSLGTLRPAREDSLDWETTRNLFIEGDNLEVLKILQRSYNNKIRLIYIDPPYNTGNDFIYPDDYSDSISSYLKRTGQLDAKGVRSTTNPEGSGRYHTDWLNMMYPRLVLARSLLSLDGAIVVHIDEHELANLIHLLGAVFGEENAVGVLVWDKRNPKGDARGLSYQHESVVFWARDLTAFTASNGLTRPKKNAAAILAKAKSLLGSRPAHEQDLVAVGQQLSAWMRTQQLSGGEAAYNKIDSNGEVYRPVSMAWPNKKKAPDEYFIPLKHPLTGRDCPVPERGWRNPPETMARLLERGEILFGPDHNTQPQRKYLLSENMDENLPSILSYAGSDDALLAELGIPFDNPKPMKVAIELIATTSGGADIVLDFFAGSGTTGHAVMAQNIADGGTRQYILVQLPEVLNPDNKDQKAAATFCDNAGKPRNIAELTKERLRKAAIKLNADNIEAKQADCGFRVYKLATSNIKTWAATEDLGADLLAAAVNLVEGRTEDDLLVELLLKQGIDLTEPVVTKSLAGRTVHAFGGGVLVVCLGDVTAADAEALADTMSDWIFSLAPIAPTTVFFKDAGFENDQAKTNVAAVLEQRLGDQLLKALSV